MPLKVTFWENPRVRPLIDGTVRADGLDFEWTLGVPRVIFQRLYNQDDADVFEMNLIALLNLSETPGREHLHWRPLPIFTSRAFFELGFEVHERAGIRDVADLRGKRFGVPNYDMAAAVWLRIVLQDLYGIGSNDVTWVLIPRGGPPRPLAPPGANVDVVQGGSLRELLAEGVVDAAFYAEVGEGPEPPLPGIHRLLSEEQVRGIFEELRRRTGLMPINHTVCVQERLLAEQSSLARELFDAFERSKQEAYARARREASGYLLFPESDFARQAETFGDDPFPYGLAANRASLERLGAQLQTDGLLRTPLDVDALFVAV